MKRLNVLAITLLTMVCAATSQNQPEHKAKMYRNSEGQLYANKNQPMYLFLSNDKAGNGSSEALDEGGAKAFYFDTEGKNTIRTPSKVDPNTKQLVLPVQDVVFDVFADGLAPSSQAIFKESTPYQKEGRTYYNGQVLVELKSKDKTSGVDKLFYSINGEDYMVYNNAVGNHQEGDYTLTFYAVDNVGNVEAISEKHYTVDQTAPSVSWRLLGDVSGKRVSARSSIELLAADALSGVKSIEYQINNEAPRLYTKPISLSNIEGGSYEFKFWASDFVQNRSEDNSAMDGGASVFSFVLDNVAPEVYSQILHDQYVGKYTYVSERSLCQLDAKDGDMVLDKITFGKNKLELDQTYNDPFSFENTKGYQVLYYQSHDFVNNKSEKKKIAVYMDNENPMTGISYEGDQFFTRDTLFINKNTSIKLFAEDADAGVKGTFYKVDDLAFKEGNELKLNEHGLHTIQFYSTDNVNNQEQALSSDVYVDNVGPEVYVNFSIKAIGSEMIDGEEVKVYPPFVKMYIGATDRHCGTDKILYSVNGSAKKNYISAGSPADSELFKKEQVYEVNVEAIDKLNNSGNKTIRFKVAKK
ncbi:hypothetical protein [Carboxylicivirga sp. M1479]|uniref:OmpL47-type beta-barrel domain-containing protein n=1 Tax=Carboxylicivirga sp. M1479 TaxID=2594476 RepID=UPI001177740E|nr:hypothetical protein [Carboxylicivirga sp. M1479]TRX72504.1 hypothetical protein FNN09_00770 [Carboxylicivirga sp. M1479]